MSIFKPGVPLGSPRRYRIKITTQAGQTFYWHKRGQLHTLEEDVATIFVQSFKPDLFQVLPDGSMVSPPRPGESMAIRGVEKEPV